MSDKKKETYNAWKQLDAYLRGTEMKSAKREEAMTLLLELETKQNNVNAKTPYFKVMDTLVRVFGNNKKFSPVLAIVFIAVFVTGILWPLRYKTFKNAKEMQKYAPQIKDLNENTKPASSLIVMSIIGGAIFPVIMGKIIDNAGDDIQKGYIVPLVCFFVVLFFGIKGYKIKKV